MIIPKWVYVDAVKGAGVCQRCGAQERLPTPCPIDVFVQWGREFGAKHRECTNHKPTGASGQAVSKAGG